MSAAELKMQLKEQPWVRKVPGRFCPKKHRLKFCGTSGDPTWRCQRLGGCPSHIRRSNCSHVGRYHCKHCELSLCENCASSSFKPPSWTKLPTCFLPQFVEYKIRSCEQNVAWVRKLVVALQKQCSLPFHTCQDGQRAARYVYKGLLATSSLLLLVGLARRSESFALSIVSNTVWISLGILVVSVTAYDSIPGVRRLFVAMRAHVELHEYSQRRAHGGCVEHWAFFTADTEHRAILVGGGAASY